MDTGHITPELTWLQTYMSAARTVWPPARVPGAAPPLAPSGAGRHGSAWISRSIASRSSQCQEGSRSTSSMRLP